MAVFDPSNAADECDIAVDLPLAWCQGGSIVFPPSRFGPNDIKSKTARAERCIVVPALRFGPTDMLSMTERAGLSIVCKEFASAVAHNFGVCKGNGNVVYFEAWKKAPLTSDQKEMLADLYYCEVCLMPEEHPGKDCSAQAKWCIVARRQQSNLWVTRGQMAPLFITKDWMTDEVINMYVEILRARVLDGTGRPLAIFSTHLALWLELPGNANNAVKCLNWYKAVNRSPNIPTQEIQSIEGFLFPCNPGRSHWTALFLDISNRADVYYDDCQGQPTPRLVNSLRKYVHRLAVSTQSEFSPDNARQVADYDHSENVPISAQGYRQENGTDCGKFLLSNASSVIDGLSPLEYTLQDLGVMTERMALEILLQQSLRSCDVPWFHKQRVAERARVSSIAASIAKYDLNQGMEEYASLPDDQKELFLLAKARTSHYARNNGGRVDAVPSDRDLRRSARLERKAGFPFDMLHSDELRLRLEEERGNLFSWVCYVVYYE